MSCLKLYDTISMQEALRTIIVRLWPNRSRTSAVMINLRTENQRSSTVSLNRILSICMYVCMYFNL